MKNKIEDNIIGKIGTGQAGFTNEKSCVDQICIYYKKTVGKKPQLEK